MANEKRLIAFDPITFESFTRHATKHREPDACQYDMGYVDACDQIDDWLDANTVSAVEVVHGHWEYGKWENGHWVKGNERCRCSVCHRDFAVDNLNIWHGCPQCLAKMDGDGNGTA